MKIEAILFRLIPISLATFLLTGLTHAQNQEVTDSLDLYKTKTFFDTLQVKASEKKWTRELFEIMVVNDSRPHSHSKASKTESTQNLSIYEGLLIRKIDIRKIDVFGPEVYDTGKVAENILQTTANKIHISTFNKIIRNHILLKQGHFLNTKEVADNERVLRNLPSINDARIFVSDYDSINRTVDLLVVVKDVWSKGFGLETGDFTNGKFDIWDRNIFGTGHQLNNIFVWDNEKSEGFEYQGEYDIRNIYGSFIDTKLRYTSIFDKNEYNISISREFFTPEIKYAGGIEYTKSSHEQIIKNEYLKDTFNLDYDFTKLWLSRSIPLRRKMLSEYRTNLILGIAYNDFLFFSGVPVRDNFLYNFQSRAMVLGEVALNSQSYYKTNYLYSFGRTEDIPIGFLASVKFGYEKNEFKDRNYTDFSLSTGYYYKYTGYLFNKFNISFFTNEAGYMEQGAVQYRLNYFSNLYRMGRFRFRQFVKLNYLTGFDRYLDEYVSLNKKEGIRGFSTDSLCYKKKLVLNMESVLFTPIYFYGFRYVFYGFADIGFTGPTNKAILSNGPYMGLGLGLRIRNERLVFRTIQLELGYYPGAPNDVDPLRIGMSGEPRLRPENFYMEEPEIFKYK